MFELMKNSGSRLIKAGLALSALTTLIHPMQAKAQSSGRPPQFVLLAFDGSKSIPMWKETRNFAATMTAQGKPVKFTYFINAVYYVNQDNRNVYIAPQKGAGKSAIGFGGTIEDVMARYDQTNQAFRERHEIANHATGHFDGSKWNQVEWTSEFRQFYDILFNIGARISSRTPIFARANMTGYRAPQLGRNTAMDNILGSFGIKYDTSRTGQPNYWPQKTAQGFWNFPLARIPIAGTGKHTLSMDYNFYFVDSGAKEDPANSAVYEERMLQSYLRYFDGNYNGNRAPLNIGHHFSQWNAGAYWRAMKRFASAVCGKPEVKCVTYQELTNYLERSGPQRLTQYENGEFDKAPMMMLANYSQENEILDLKVDVSLRDDGVFQPRFKGNDAAKIHIGSDMKTVYTINGKILNASKLDMNLVRQNVKRGETAIVSAEVFMNGRKIQSATHEVFNVGTDNEVMNMEPKESAYFIADPPEAHDE